MRRSNRLIGFLNKHSLKWSLPFIALASLLLAPSAPARAAEETQKRVLVLYATTREAPGSIIGERIYQKTLKEGLSGRLDYYSEYIDIARFPDPAYKLALRDFLRRKYEKVHFDLIIATSNTNYEFLEQYGVELFPNVPVVFSVNGNVPPRPNATGLFYDIDMKPTLDLGLRLQPRTKRVFVVSGASDYDKYYEAIARRQFQELEKRVAFTYLAGLPMPDLRRAVANLPADSIIFFTSLAEDGAGTKFFSTDSLDKISEVANAPVYAFSEIGMDHGIVGGSLVSTELVTNQTSELALRVLRGNKPENIPVARIDANVNEFDWRQLRRWGINENNLPPGSIVRFKQPTLWEQYKWHIVGVSALCILEALLIVGLLLNRSRRRQAQRESERFAELARAEHRRLDEVVSNVPGMVWEVSIEPGSGKLKTQYVSRFVEQMLGYRAEDFLNTTGFGLSLIPEEDRERVELETNEIFAAGTSGTIQYRWLTRDGRLLWVEAQLAVMRDEHDRPVGLHGVTMDITDRKMAEEAVRQSEARNRDILRALPDIMFLQTLDGVYLDYHAKDPSDLFVPPTAFLGKNMRDILPPQLSEDFFRCFRGAEATDEPQILEYALPLQDEDRWFEARMVRSKGDQVLSIVRDVTDRRRAEEDLRGSEERFAKAFRANPQPMSLTTLAEGRYLDVNESFLTMSGYTREEVIGRTSLELGIWDTPGARSEFMQLLKKRGAIHNLDTTFRPKSGSSRLLLSSAEQFELGGEHCVLIASSDITERHRAVKELRQSEERFRNMADTAPVLIWISGTNKLCTYFNQGWLEFTGRTMEQELGEGWTEGIYSEDYARCLEIYNSAFDCREPFKMEYRLRCADGVFHWIYDCGTPRFSSDGEFLGYIGSCIDIADRKEAEDAVRAAKDELRLVADALPVLISEVDKNGCYSFHNLAYEKWFGLPSDQIIGHHMREVLGETVWERIRPKVESALAGHEVHYEDSLQYRHGGSRWVSVTGIPTRDAEGQVNGFVSLVADITESRRAEEALRDLSGRLINAQEEERSRVARELHDDLSQRIAVLSIGLEQVGQQIPEGSDNLHARIHSLWTETQEVSTEVHRLSYQLHPQKLDHLGLVAAARSFCQELAAHHEISITFRQQGFPASLSKEITLCLFRIVQESLHNAVKHSGAREAQVVLERTDQAVRLSVSDTGCGFNTESSKMTSGLGFTSMRERLRLVGGQLSIRSRPSQGTKIEVTVPLLKRAERASVGLNSQSTNQSRTEGDIDESSQLQSAKQD